MLYSNPLQYPSQVSVSDEIRSKYPLVFLNLFKITPNMSPNTFGNMFEVATFYEVGWKAHEQEFVGAS